MRVSSLLAHQRIALSVLISLLAGPIIAAPPRGEASPEQALLPCSNAALRNSLSFMPGALLATSPTSGQVQKTSARTPSCTQRVTITSTPCHAAVYIDDMQSGHTPITFPMPPGRYTVVLVAPGHLPFAQRILISDGPVELQAHLTPRP